jgi:hypothetical protein
MVEPISSSITPPRRARRIPLKYKFLGFILVVLAGFVSLFMFYPRGASLIFSYRIKCKVLRVEQFLKGVVMTNPGQANKFAVSCEDGLLCRSQDTGFAAVKAGDVIEFRGYPEFGTFEEFGKCDNAQLIRLIPAQ